MQALLLNKAINQFQEVELSEDIEKQAAEIRDLLQCSVFDAPLHQIGTGLYRILADDEGWPRVWDGIEDHRLAAQLANGEPMIYGNLLFVRQDGTLLAGLAAEDIANIRAHSEVLPRYGLVVSLG